MKLSEVTEKVIALSSAIRDYWEEELPKRHPDYPIVRPGDEDGPPPPEEAKLRELLAGLPEEQLYQLGLVMYVGSWIIDAQNTESAYDEVKDRLGDWPEAIDWLATYVPLGDYLLNGLEKLEKNRVDVDAIWSGRNQGDIRTESTRCLDL